MAAAGNTGRKIKTLDMTKKLTAQQFIKELKALRSDAELKKYERFFPPGRRDGDKFIGVRMGQVFELAKEFIEMPLAEIEKLMESPLHEARAGALSIMGKSASHKKTSPPRLQELYDLYIRRHDRVNNWDLVDLGALYVVGRYLFDKKRDILYKLAKSKDQWERRTAIVSTGYFIRKRDVEDTFKIAAILAQDREDFVNKGTGWMLRSAGDVDRAKLLKFLDKYAATMPRALLRYAIEKLDKSQREHYLGVKKIKE